MIPAHVAGVMVAVSLIGDRYELLEVIASGGMATVWRARDRRLDRVVAVKRPHPATPAAESAGGLAREARAAASLSHPNLITVYDVGSDETGAYLVMELVEGSTLQEDAGGVDATEAVDIGAQLADALAAIHAAGIVHRDVKPANVIMSERGPVLTDFGIALIPGTTASITGPSNIVATPSYAAPEVLAGGEPTAASDIYSLAVTIDEILRRAGSVPGRDFEVILAEALSDSPDARPDAVSFGANLRRNVATAARLTPGEPTLELEPALTPRPGEDEGTAKRSVPAWLVAAGLLVVLGVGLAVLGLAQSGRNTSAVAALAPAVTTTVIVETSTTASPNTAPPTTAPPTTTSAGSVDETRSELESLLTAPPRSDLNPPESRDLLKKIDEAIAASREGDQREAEKKLSEAAKRVAEKLDSEKRDDAMLLLEDLAEQLGLGFDLEEEVDDD